MHASVSAPAVVLEAADWTSRSARHAAAVDERVSGHLQRRGRGEKHPVEDFLFTYYRLRPAALRRWHPGVGTGLAPDNDEVWRERARWRWYAERDGVVDLDVAAYLGDRAGSVRLAHELLTATASRAPQLGCFGLHEWAMVYRVAEGGRRHESHPLRLGSAGTDAVVQQHRITCTHFDAFRFFTDDARPLNALQPTRDRAVELEQPGCLHATMDLYKFAYQLGPAVPGDLLLACFDLAREVRVLDMQASPYDLADLGYPPVTVETAPGRAEYARRQGDLSERAAPLRRRLVEVCETLLAQESAGRAPARPAQRAVQA